MTAEARIDAQYRLEDRYTRDHGRVFLTGIQALVRLPLVQRRIDVARGHHTAGLVSGYRGSPLGGYDQELWRARSHLDEHHVRFEPGINEDLGATMVWGTQRLQGYPGARYDGVFGIWYGKGPGVDRCGDVFRHANMAGTALLGGVLALAGDDHNASSSIFPHQTDGILTSCLIPVLNPASVAELLEFGLAGIALSRYSGLWVGMKTIAEVVEAGGVVDLDALQTDFRGRADAPALPQDHTLNWDPSIAWPAQRWEFERRVLEERIPAVRAFTRANGLDRIVWHSPRPRFGIVTVGKAHQDLLQALATVGLDEARAGELGLTLYKVGVSWPLEEQGIHAFADGLERLLVVEEKQPLVEDQLKAQLYHVPTDLRPRIWGKRTPAGHPFLSPAGDFSPMGLARHLAEWLADTDLPLEVRERFRSVASRAMPAPETPLLARKPYFCAGCPHNRSTRIPDGSEAGGGIGCHAMVLGQGRHTEVITHMGAEGVNWVGLAPFTEMTHQFQNLGDGTYQHSGILAIRQAQSAGTNITFKILYNDAVAMTGGQPAEGGLSVEGIAQQVYAEGVRTIVVLAEDPADWKIVPFPPGTELHPRGDLEAVQRRLREVEGVSVLIYVQTCAAEKRRRRKRGSLGTPDTRMFIHPEVCEGCGDCSAKSSCIAVEPFETGLGRKRRINQSACNYDYSCAEGFCPSFVAVDGARLAKPDDDVLARLGIDLDALPEAPLPATGSPDYNVLVTGIGGSGVVTIGALISMAAHLEGRYATVLDQTGLAQKNGAVVSHVRVTGLEAPPCTPRIPERHADLLLACDQLVAAADGYLPTYDRERTHVLLNTETAPTSDWVNDPDTVFPEETVRRRLRACVDPQRILELPVTAWATALLGDAIGTNLFLVGVALQRGLLPVSPGALERAIELNGVAVTMNRRALALGRFAALDPEAFARRVAEVMPVREEPPETLDALIADRAERLVAYQGAALADRYRDRVEAVRELERRVAPHEGRLTRSVAEQYFRLLAVKDEYEVARLYASPAFRERLGREFSDWKRLRVQLAPPLLSRPDPVTGEPRKRAFGPWIFPAFGLLARLRGLRGTAWDPFGHTEERRTERRLAAEYEAWLDGLGDDLGPSLHETACALAALPARVRGFGPVKLRNVRAYEAERARLQEHYGHLARHGERIFQAA